MTQIREAYTLSEIADTIGPVSIRTVHNWIRREGLVVTRIAGRPMVLRADLEAFLGKSAPAGQGG